MLCSSIFPDSPSSLYLSCGISSCAGSLSRPFGPNSFTCKCSFCTGLLVRFKASGFWYNLSTRPITEMLSHIRVILRLWFHQPVPSPIQQVTDRMDAGVCQLKALDVCLGGSWVLSPGFWDHPSQVMGRASFLYYELGVGLYYEWQGQGPLASIPPPVRSRAGEGHCWLSTALGLPQALFDGPL